VNTASTTLKPRKNADRLTDAVRCEHFISSMVDSSKKVTFVINFPWDSEFVIQGPFWLQNFRSGPPGSQESLQPFFPARLQTSFRAHWALGG
jgi:hypothetical protein